MATTKKATTAPEAENTAPVQETAAPVTEATAPVQEAPAAPAKEEKVEIFIPKGYANDEPNLLVGVNGKMFLLPKGQKSVVPKYIADEIHRSWAAETTMDKHIAEMVAEASK